MIKILSFLFFLYCLPIFAQQWTISEVGQLPEQVTNNPVCEGWQGDTLYIYTFGGVDNTLIGSGIHLRSYRYNTISGSVESIPDMPDTLGKLGVAANRIGDIIYVVGGYHVLSGGGEVTSDKVHRFNTQTNTWMSDAPPIPVATDDHVQAVWKDSLIFLVTGWKNTANIQHCQIFDPANNQWLSGTSLPNSHDYKSFGASGTIIGDTLYYFGGTSSWNFNPQNKLRMGIINPNDPSDVSWSISTPDPNIYGYRMAATSVNGQAHWIGGSSLSYNFDGIDYNGSGVVAPAYRDLYLQHGTQWWYSDIYDTIPMDQRGIGNASDSIKYLIGGLFDGQNVSDKIYRLEYIGNPILNLNQNENAKIKVYPNPSLGKFSFSGLTEDFQIQIFDSMGNLVLVETEEENIDFRNFESGIYLAKIRTDKTIQTIKIIKQ